MAEGVEAIEQVRFLSALGVERGQGYLWSRPVDIATFGPALYGRRVGDAEPKATPLAPCADHSGHSRGRIKGPFRDGAHASLAARLSRKNLLEVSRS